MYQLNQEIDKSATLISDSINFNSNDLLKPTNRFEINDDFGLYLFDALKTLKTQAEFDNVVKGIVLIPDYTVSNAMLSYNLSSNNITSSNYISVNYSYDKVDFDNIVIHRDTISVLLALDQASKKGIQLSIDKSNAELSSLSNTNDILVGNKCYVQGITGIQTKLEFPSYDMVIQKGKNIVFNKVELIVTPQSNIEYALPEILFLKDVENNRIYDNATLTNGKYIFKNTSLLDYFQFSYLEQKTPKFMLVASNTDISRAVIDVEESPIQLKIFFTEFE